MRQSNGEASGILRDVQDICRLGPRLPGSEAEKACHDLVLDRLQRLNHGATEVDGFGFKNWTPLHQQLLSWPGDLELPVTQLGYSPSGCVEGGVAWCGGGTKEECRSGKGLMAVCSSTWESSAGFLHRIEKYRNACQAGSTAFILLGEPGHPTPMGIIRKRTPGTIPAVAMSYLDGRRLLDLATTEDGFRLRTESAISQGLSMNTVWRSGGKRPGTALCAHCDSWSEGAWDNASGVATLLHLAGWLTRHRPVKQVALCFTGAEEYGLFGSRELCSRHKDEFAVAISVDGLGLGREVQVRCSDRRLASLPPLRGVFSDLPLTPWGDHWSFYQAGIPTLFLTSGGENPAQHTQEDSAQHLKQTDLESSFNLLCKIVAYLDSLSCESLGE